jgi:ATP-dependent helicase/nuclease subunit B
MVFEIVTKELNKLYKDVQNVDKSTENSKLKQVISTYRYFKDNSKKYSEILEYIKDDSNLNTKTIEEMYKDNLKTSVSKLELFKKCPFSYYINYGLKLNLRKIYTISNMDIGSFMHAVLEKFSIYIFDNNISWKEVLLEKGQALKEKLNDIINEELDYSLSKHKESVKFAVLRQKLINTMQKVIITIAKGFNQSEFEPYGYELEFREGKLFSPIHIKLNEKEDMYLVGKIDRIDTAKINDKVYARIVDYKSSNKVLSIDDIKEGVSLQLVTYLHAFIESKKNLENIEITPSAMLYFNLSDKLINLSSYPVDSIKVQKEIAKNLRMNGIFLKDIEVIKKMDNKLETDERLIDISARTINSNSSKKVLEEVDYTKLCEDVKDILKQIGNEIMSGVVKIKPLKKKDVCKYCNFASVCRKDICL